MFAEKYSTVKSNCNFLDKLPGKMYIINANGQIPANCKDSKHEFLLARNKKQSKTGGLAKCYLLFSWLTQK